MEIERAFRLAVPAILHRDLGDGDGLAPAFAAQADRRHAVAAHEAELAGLIDDAAQAVGEAAGAGAVDRKSTRLNSSHYCASRMPSSACKKITIMTETPQQQDEPNTNKKHTLT